ncbi:WW domain-binding protein 1 isoform 1 [Mus musculus]|uniref:WW domain-binding protein 1 n=1 Tax=Mus musculus TaxID=10090 RepID=WBP1_MOUSE|nr:WW domain-binding protein 1 isoform 1 [Mus musculus]P97764.2 RecName: Full=WW domain-binding protein 1; Short=WBP-1 [Mus musculus]AAH05666.1 WW domain binding protein 1 [synthetic construct]EDK99062.1 WW domain binding protein 1, isoform CRA_a [Mus musculus]|eukprot:NP_058037.2 WW domain-binding protein 1 isoform 1 [Mus musculus]
MARASSRNSSEEAWGSLQAPQQQQSPAASSLEGAIWRRAGTQTRALDTILYHPQQSHLLRELCPGVNTQPYLCETGHCCGETGCCTYYYELWWFWLLWTVLILFSCCCAFRHRRAKLRLQQQQRQREINLLAYHGACHGAGPVPTGSLLDLRLLSAFKPPAYEDVVHHPGTPPPPYTVGPGYPWTTSSECTRCSSESSCSAHLEGTNVEGVSSQQSALPHQEGEPRAGLSPVHIPPSCRYRRLTGDSGIELCPCPDSSEGEPLKEARASASQPDLEDHSPCALPPDSVSQVPPMGLASSCGDIP